ncbi:unnamed protein product [Paramecium pentaurelia]|uniref:EGF-like domain-containing protein n=1 Tax=Paramecium pentaurelia TaxID=43138 RepID=A0A8S1WU94_9CILI|nr:unnamed protein product [Paramecium pentaurelia]
MINPIFGIALYLISIIEVFGVSQVISSSFQGNSFSNDDNWVVSGAQPQFTDCMGQKLFGDFSAFGRRVSASKTFELPPHSSINLQVQFWKIDSWDSEYGYIFVDYQIAWQKKYNYYDGSSMCGGNWNEHSGPTAMKALIMSLGDLEISLYQSRNVLRDVQYANRLILYLNVIFGKQYRLVGTNQILMEQYWMVGKLYLEFLRRQCGSVVLFGGYQKTGTGTVISKSFFNIPPHYQLKIQILWAKIDSWDNEAAQMRVDSVLVQERRFQWYEGYFGKVCGNSDFGQRTIFVRNEIDLNHTSSQVEIQFSTTLNEPIDNESFGLRDFTIFYGSCINNCAQCTGPKGSQCLMCSIGCYNTGVIDIICQLCYPSCYQCDGPSIDNCTDCGDPNIYHKQLVAGQCLCLIRTIEYIQNDETLCLPCHPRCEKCYLPFYNTVNEYCTMCIAGQDRVVSDQLNYVCKAGYGDDGISDICVQCHYTCENCNGPLATNCTTCSSQSNRHLTSDKQCLCNKACIDTGINQVMCLYICHHTCSDCDLPGEDQCTNCPITRQPDVIGNHFKCQCKDSHYFSDDTQLNCLECHFTCKTCNGIYDNNCLTCDLSHRQLVMFKCICPYGYYDVGQLQCSPCYYTCMTCFGPEEDNCITCAASNYREVRANKCLCLNTYMEKLVGDPLCYKCSYRCANCSGTIDKCTSCPVFSFRDLGTDNSCSCPAKSYDQPGNPNCIVCHSTCLTCNGSQSNQCISCNAQIMRYLDPSGFCLCQSKYFDVGQPECLVIHQNNPLACSANCLNCVNSADNCTSCKPDRYLQGNLCLCQTKLNGAAISTYLILGKAECQSCHYSCLNCNGSTFNKCTSCLDSEMRTLQNSNCICEFHYFDIGKPKCQQCNYSCQTCAGLDTNCLSCYPNTFRTLINSQCQCQKGYFDDGSNSICQECHYSCSQCSSISTKCCSIHRCLLVIVQILIMILEQKLVQNVIILVLHVIILDFNVTQTCICKPGTTDINFECQICDITCQTCQNSITSCTSCKILRLLFNNQCNCIDGTYESGNDKQCLFCNKTCFTCINRDDYCTSCSADQNRIFKTGNMCICQNGYYEESITLNCKQCDQSCLTCKISPTYCLTCDASYNLSLDVLNRCVCSTGFYFNTSTLKCEGIIIVIQLVIFHVKNAKNYRNIFFPDNLSCPCIDGYYEAFFKKCSQCDLSCKTCINQSTKCLSCELNYFRVLNNNNQCNCLDGYYDIGIEMCQLCNLYCNTCYITSTKCTSCNLTKFFRLLNLNECICQNGYYDNGSLICEKCSNQCLTCKGKRDYCTSCDLNQNRIDQSVINKCPCSSGFYENEYENCQKCHLKCQTCNQSKENCINCSYSITSNRQSISQNCICKDGYFDDGIQLDCQKCSTRCKYCLESSTHCLTCFSNLRDTPPICNCKLGFFENSAQNCEQCENQCLTCEKTPANCLICKEGRLSKQCLCQDGYYVGGQPLCIQCDFQCKICKDSSLNCLICEGDRINIPKCECPEGFYDDLQNESCQVCYGLCKTCNVDGCLSCNGNRILSPEMSCDQPPNSVSHPDTPWCSTCEVAVVDVRFSDDLLSILVKFDFLLNPSFFTTQFQDNVCLKILDYQTYQLLGKNPICYVDPDDDTILIMKVGQQVKIIPGDKIIFYDNYFGHQECERRLKIFIFNQIKNPINPVSPKISYDIPTYLINPCDDNIIPLKQKLNDGLRGLIGIKWTYSVSGSNGNGDLDNFVASLTSLQMLELVIPFQTLPKQSNITFYLEFQNFVTQKNIHIIKLQTHSGQFPTILWIQKLYYYTFETIFLQFQIKKKECSESAVAQIDNSEYILSLVEVYRNDSNSRPSRVNYQESTRQSFFNVTIQNYTLTSRIAYTFQQTTIDPLLNFSITRNITLEISSGGIFCQFNGTKKIQNYRKDTQIYISCRDLDTQYDWNEDLGIQINVECVDLTLNSLCMDVNKKIIKVNKSDSIQIIPKQSIQPYTIQCWTVVASKQQYSYKFKQNIVYLDNDFKLLNVTYSKGYLMRPINNYENLDFIINIPFQDRQYLLEYQIAVIYNFELIKILQSEYFKYQFRVFDYFQEFTKGKQINLKFLAQFTNEIIPINCQLTTNLLASLSEQIVEALKLQKIITICDFSDSAPFTYQLRYFLKNQDLLDFLNRKYDYSLILNSYQSSNVFEGYFPFADGILLIQVMDSKGLYLNIEKKLNIKKTVLNCSQINIYQFNLKQQDQKQCINLSKQLYLNIKTFLGNEDIDVQLLIYQTTQLYKRLIQNNDNSKFSIRLLNDNSESCFENSTKNFYIQNAKINSTLNVTPNSLQAELKQVMTIIQKMIKKSTDLDDQIHKDDVFLDEKLYQKKEAILNSFQVVLFLIDDIFLKIPTVTISSNEDKLQILNVSEQLINLIEKISIHVNIQAKVNGPEFIINGQILKWQFSKITKDILNNQFDIEKDLLDGLIDFVQKEQIELNYNYLNLSQELQAQLQIFFNLTTLEINENSYKKTNLQNHLYNGRYIDCQDTIKQYIIDMFTIPYCQGQIPLEKLYFNDCAIIDQNGQFQKFELLTEEINNQTVYIQCKCQKFGSIYLIKYLNYSIIQQNIPLNIYNEYRVDNSNLQLSEQPILLFHGIFIAFSFFFYFQLISIEIKSKQTLTFTRVDSDVSVDETQRKEKSNKALNFYPGNFSIFKKSFKFIHEILSFFIQKIQSFQKVIDFYNYQSKQKSLLDQITIFSILLINCGTFLFIRMILKILQSIYRFNGKWSIFIVIIYLLIHLFCYLEFILQLKQCQEDLYIINIEISIILIVSFLLFYVILDPIMIFLRIIILKHIIIQIRDQRIDPFNQLVYFFVGHQKLDELFHYYAIM